MKRTPLFLLVPVLALAGCELLVDFDRTKIPSDAVDGSVIIPGNDGSVEQPDATVNDGGDDTDAATEDGGDAGDSDGGDTDGGDTDGGDTDGGDTDGGDGGDAG